MAAGVQKNGDLLKCNRLRLFMRPESNHAKRVQAPNIAGLWSGPKSHWGYGFWNQKPRILGACTLGDLFEEVLAIRRACKPKRVQNGEQTQRTAR